MYWYNLLLYTNIKYIHKHFVFLFHTFMGLTLRKKTVLKHGFVAKYWTFGGPWGCSLWYFILVNSKEIFYMFYSFTSMTSMRPPWPLWPRCLPWQILINSSLNSHNSLFVSDSQNIKLQGYPQRMRLQRRLIFLIFMHPFFSLPNHLINYWQDMTSMRPI